MYLRCAVLLDRLLTCPSFHLLYSSSFIRSSPFHFRSSLSSLWLRPYLALARLLSTLPLTPSPPSLSLFPSRSPYFFSLSPSVSLFLSFSIFHRLYLSPFMSCVSLTPVMPRITVSFSSLFLAPILLCTTLPLFPSYSELVRYL